MVAAIVVLSLTAAGPASVVGQEKKDDTFTMKKGAGIGALLGLALGSGNIIEDTVRGEVCAVVVERPLENDGELLLDEVVGQADGPAQGPFQSAAPVSDCEPPLADVGDEG